MEYLDQNVSLENYNTFGIDANASYFATIIDSLQLVELSKTEYWEIPKFILGGGSNILLLNDFEGLVIHMANKGIEVVEESDDDIVLRVQAGEQWHDFVLHCVNNGYGGVENLSLIPGSVGASPMQNIGAYGVEIKEVFEKLTAFHIETNEFKTFYKKNCNFGYRTSIFKQTLKNQYIITSVDYRLQKNPKLNLSYGAIKATLKEMKIEHPTIKDVSNVVIKIRESKLPDPNEIGNAGSFFKNPIIPKSLFEELLKKYPQIPHYTIDKDHEKVPAGWLIEQADFKGKIVGHTGTYKKQALIIINNGGATGQEIWDFSKRVQLKVKEMFNIEIEPEVNVVS